MIKIKIQPHNKIEKKTAENLQGIAAHLFTDTRRIVVRHGKLMQEVYDPIRAACVGRELSHVEYLLKQYRKALRNDDSTKASEGSIGQVCAAIVKLCREGRFYPENYAEARAIAYPPKLKGPRQPAAKEDGSEADDTPEPAPVKGRDKVAAVLAIVASMNLAELQAVAISIEVRIAALEAAEDAESESDELDEAA